VTTFDTPFGLRARSARPIVVLFALSVAMLVLLASWALIDSRTLDGSPVWAKPVKFAVSFVLLFATLALFDKHLSPAWRDSRTLTITVAVMALSMMTEMSYMIAMAAQGKASHFNLATPFTAFMYTVMGVGAVSLIAGVAVYGIAALRDAHSGFGPALRWGIGWGSIMTFALTLVTAGYMSSTATHVGVEAAGASVIPIMGWSGTVGDIRPSHFLALHGMQVLPLAGLWFDRKNISVRYMKWLAAGYAIITLAVFAQALAGLPLIRLS
jgi:hypothetical protein